MQTKVTNNVKNFLGDLVEACYENKITLKLVHSKQLHIGKIKCSGMFDEKSLQVSTDHDLEIWLGVLVHESCHMDQYLQNIQIWRDIDPHLIRVDSWVTDPDYKIWKKAEAFEKVVELELDCEKRAIKKINKYKLPINKERYIRGANSYLFAYGAAMRNRRWYKHPYKRAEIWGVMPGKFLRLANYVDPKHPLLDVYDEVYKNS